MVAPSVDLLAALRPSAVSVTVAGIGFTLDASTASHWLGAMALDLDNLYGIMPGLIADDDLDTMHEVMATHPDIADRWRYAAQVALGRAAGRDWWWALNLSRKALGTWIYTNGILLRQNVDAKTMQLGDWMDACYSLYWQNANEEERMKLDMSLSMRPRGMAIRQTKADVRKMVSDFAAD